MHLSYGVCRLHARLQLKTLSSLLKKILASGIDSCRGSALRLLVNTVLYRCGLSAISMASELIQKQKADTETAFCAGEEQHNEELDKLLSMARSKGYSCQGEMYSTENLGRLAREFYGLGCQVISYGFEDHHLIVSELLKGSAVLVPYDADKNHKPCLENGNKAHWALLTGQCD